MRGNRDSALREHKQIPVSAETPEKGTGTLQETEPNLPASAGAYSEEAEGGVCVCVNMAHCGAKSNGSRRSGMYLLV